MNNDLKDSRSSGWFVSHAIVTGLIGLVTCIYSVKNGWARASSTVNLKKGLNISNFLSRSSD